MVYIILILSLFGIIYGASNLVDGSTSLAKRYRVSDFIIGALIVGIGTSMPELVVSLIGTFRDNPDVAIGNVVGSNIFNILGILGATAIIFPIPIKKENVKFDILYCIGLSVFLTLLILGFSTNTLNIYGGICLLLAFGGYIYLSFKTNNITDPITTEIDSLSNSILKVVGGLVILIFSCNAFVDNAVIIAKNFGLSDAVIALTLISCGTSLPEFSASMVAAFKKNTQMALGNIIGSNIFNISFILGTCSMISPLNSLNIGYVDYFAMIGAAVIMLFCGFLGKINRITGIMMFLLFITYICWLMV